MGRWVCDDVTTGGRASLAIGRGFQMKCHLLGDEGVEVHVVKTVPTPTEGLGRVGWGTGRTGTHRNARHRTAEAWKEEKVKKLNKYEATANCKKSLFLSCDDFPPERGIPTHRAVLWPLWKAAGPSPQSCPSLGVTAGSQTPWKLLAGRELSVEVELCRTGSWWGPRAWSSFCVS